MRRSSLLCLALAALILSSCGAYKRQAYLQDMEPELSYSVPDRPQAKISKGDILGITVSCGSPALAAPFNVTSGSYVADPATGTQSLSVGHSGAPTYEVSDNGDIIFPVLGAIKVEGMTLKEVKLTIEGYISSRRYIKDPVVNVEFSNFKITILGEVGHVGTYNISDGSVNIFEAVAMAGDLGQDARKDDVWVIRTTPGKRTTYTINLKSKDCYYSPVFYLQQNDMIYVPPRDGKIDSSWSSWSGTFSTGLTFLSVLSSLLYWYRLSQL